MEAITDFIIKVNCPEGPGSGFVYNPGVLSEDVYVITARHCLFSKNGRQWDKNEMTIGYLADNWNDYPIPTESTILFGDNNDREDIGLIVIKKSALPEKLLNMGPGTLAMPPAKMVKIQVTGFPMFGLTELKRSLYQLELVSDVDYPMQLQFELKDPVSGEHNADNLVEGYSGSPLIIYSGDTPFICGIFLEYEPKTKRVIGFDLTLLEKLLKNAGKPELKLKAIEVDDTILADIISLKSNTNRVIGRIRNHIGVLHLSRPTIEESVIKALANQKMAIISGKPGSGKSAIIKEILSKKLDSELIALQGEQLDRPSLNEVFSGGASQVKNQLSTLLDSPKLKRQKIILIDSIEKILESTNAETILDFFDLISKREDIKLVLTCRSYALDTLKLRFLQEFPPFEPLEVGLLDENELLLVEQTYPALKPILANSRIKEILRVPFNLDKAVQLSGAQISDINSEKQFKQSMWALVIENSLNETNPEIRRLRSLVMMEIAIKRAEQMSPFIIIPGLNEQIIQQLVAEQIIDVEPVEKLGYAAAHDIYEDWSITRYIEQIYQQEVIGSGSVLQFFNKLGNAASIRRSFRIWIGEKIQEIDFNIKDTIHTALNENGIATYWQDELLIAILQNNYSISFLEEETVLLFANDFKIFKRCLILLDVACQEPDFRYLGQLEPDKRIMLYHRINLVPFGAGWANIIDLSYRHLDQLENITPLVVKMILQWKKGITDYALPPEAKNAGLIVLRFLNDQTGEYSDRTNRSSDADDVEECIRLLFRLSVVIKTEVEELIRKAFTEKEKAQPWQLRNFYEKVIELALSGHEDRYVCGNYPKLVIEIAEKEWIYIPPTPDELEQMFRGTPFEGSPPMSIRKEKEFGINDDTGLDYFPPSFSQTPILNLLYSEPVSTLHFIVKLMNYVAESYWESDFGRNGMFLPAQDNRVIIAYTLDDGTRVEQMGSTTLWNIYRGFYIATPYLLNSVLMALEYWLLEIGECLKKTKSEQTRRLYEFCFEQAYTILLKESNNVSTTAVLLSVAYEHRDLARKYILPLFSVSEFYNWDTVRYFKDRHPFSVLGTFQNAQLHQQRMIEFNKREHRGRDLRYLLLNYGLSEGREQIFVILDQLYQLTPADTDWQLQVNSMDVRRLTYAGDSEEGVLVKPLLEGELLAAVEESQRQIDRMQPAQEMTQWGLQRWDHKDTADNSFIQWGKYYQTYQNFEGDETIPRINKLTGLIAALGIRDYYSELDSAMLDACTEKIMQIIHQALFERPQTMEDFMRPEHSPFEVDAAFYVLPILMTHVVGSAKKDFRERIIYILLNCDQAAPLKELQKSLRDNVWVKEPQFMLNCIGGLLKFEHVAHIRQIIMSISQSQQTPEPYWRLLLQVRFKWIVNGFRGKIPKPFNYNRSKKILEDTWNQIFLDLNNETTALNFQIYQFAERGNNYFVFQSLKLIPADTDRPELLIFYEKLLKFILNHIEKDEDHHTQRLHFTHQQQFHKRFAQFLLRQPEERSSKFFDMLIDDVYSGNLKPNYRHKKFEFIQKCLESIITAVIFDETLAPRFWYLWHKLGEKILNTGINYFTDKVLLDQIYFSMDATDWEPIHGQKAFYERFIQATRHIRSSSRLLASIGFTEMIPDGISWLAAFIEDEWTDEKNTLKALERLTVRCFYTNKYRKMIKSSSKLRKAFILIIDHLIDKNASATAFLIREDFISQNPADVSS